MKRASPTLIILVAAFALRAWVLPIESLWRDEVDTLRFAFEPLNVADFTQRFFQTGFNGPLYLLGMRGWLLLAGSSDFSLRYSSLFAGILLLACIFALTRALTRCLGARGVTGAWIALSLAAFMPVLVWYSTEGKMYSWQPFVLTFALLALLRASRTNSWLAWLAFVVASSASFYMHVLSPLFVPVAGLAWLMWRRLAINPAGTRRGWTAFALLILPYVPLAIWQARALLRAGPTGHPYYGWAVSTQSLLLNWSLGLNPMLPFRAPESWTWAIVSVFWLLPTFLWIFVIFARPEQPWAKVWQTLLPVIIWLLLPPTLLMLISLRMPLFEPRYVLWCATALYVLAGLLLGHAVHAAQNRSKFVGVLTGIIMLCSLGVAGLGNASHLLYPIRPDLRGAAEHVRLQLRPGDYVVYQIPYTRYSFEHYAVFPAHKVDGPYTNNNADLNEVDDYMRQQLAGARRVWLVESETPLWDYDNLTRGWLERVWRVKQKQEFYTVVVSLHEPR